MTLCKRICFDGDNHNGRCSTVKHELGMFVPSAAQNTIEAAMNANLSAFDIEYQNQYSRERPSFYSDIMGCLKIPKLDAIKKRMKLNINRDHQKDVIMENDQDWLGLVVLVTKKKQFGNESILPAFANRSVFNPHSDVNDVGRYYAKYISKPGNLHCRDIPQDGLHNPSFLPVLLTRGILNAHARAPKRNLLEIDVLRKHATIWENFSKVCKRQRLLSVSNHDLSKGGDEDNSLELLLAMDVKSDEDIANKPDNDLYML